MQNINKVLYNHDQSSEFTAEEKAVARNNIGAQAQLTAGSGISISGSEISCTVSPGPTYTAGTNVSIDNNVISATDTKYTAGSNVSIDGNNVISATNTTYTAGTNVSISSGNVISATDTTYTAGTNVSIDGTVISATDTTYGVFSTSADGLVPKANNTGDTGKFLRGDHTWQYPASGTVGDINHPNYITQDSGGQLHFLRSHRLFWEFTFSNPSVELTADDITNGYAEFRFALGSEGAEIAENGNIVAMKGYDLYTGNILNGKQLSFYLVGHGSTSPRMLMDSGFTTFTESTVNNYDWKAFKAIGLSMNRNTSKLDAVLRVPLSSESAGDTFSFSGYVTVTVFGVSQNDASV